MGAARNSRDSTRVVGYSDESHRFFIIILFFVPPLSVRLYYTDSSTRMMQPGQEYKDMRANKSPKTRS
jgi:hypothetical protein